MRFEDGPDEVSSARPPALAAAVAAVSAVFRGAVVVDALPGPLVDPLPPARPVEGVHHGWRPADWADELERRAGICIDSGLATELRAEAARIRAAS